MELTNRTILITGGATGIGYALARTLIERNNQVIICGRNRNKLEQAKEKLAGINTIQCDITRTEDLNCLVSTVSGRYPKLDTLINNAGIQQQLDFTANNISELDIVNEINTNLTAQINITNRLYPLLTSNGHAVITFTGSALGIVPKYDFPVYSASKAGLHSFVKALRQQVNDDPTTVIEIIPDVIDTPMTRDHTQKKKMSTEIFARQVVEQMTAGSTEIFIGRTRLLRLINKISPWLAETVVN